MTSESQAIDIDYRRGRASFAELIETIEQRNATLVDRDHRAELEMLRSSMNHLYTIASEFSWLFNAPHIAIQSQATKLLFSALHKNLIATHTSLKLTRIGLYGPARSMMRHVFEALLIAKFCSVSEDSRLYEKWKEGDVVYLTNGILKKLEHPDIAPFSDLWELLSGYSHATIYAQQVHLNVEASPNDVPLNLVYLRILIACQYHLLTSHLITPSMVYYNKRYRNDADPLPALRGEMRRLLTKSNASLLEMPRSIIKSYQSKWKIKSP